MTGIALELACVPSSELSELMTSWSVSLHRGHKVSEEAKYSFKRVLFLQGTNFINQIGYSMLCTRFVCLPDESACPVVLP